MATDEQRTEAIETMRQWLLAIPGFPADKAPAAARELVAQGEALRGSADH